MAVLDLFPLNDGERERIEIDVDRGLPMLRERRRGSPKCEVRSVEHAFEDLRTRRWIEAKLRARDTLAATRKGLAARAGELDADYRAKVEAALKAVEELLAGEDAATQSGDTVKLKAALAALDETTQPLADLLMDEAVEALLRKRGVI